LRKAKWYAAQPWSDRKSLGERALNFRLRRARRLDIDQIIADVRAKMPNIVVTQWSQSWPADDDGLWFFDFAGHPSDDVYSRASVQCVQIESSFGQVPFIVETEELCCERARTGNGVAEIVSMILDHTAGRTGA
jgi:hypothetical protein